MADSFERNKLPIWDLGGTLNELDPASECPPNDVIYIRNWRVHEDGKSREKRPGYEKIEAGYSSINEPVRGVFEYSDIYNNQHVVIVGSTKIVDRENVWTYTQQYQDNDGDYTLGWRQPFIYQGKLCIIDHGPDAGKLQCLSSEDGSTWTQLWEDSGPISISISAACGVCEFNGEIMMGSYTPGAGSNIITRWDGAINDECLSPWAGTYTFQIFRWDGKAWIVFYRTGDYLIYYYNGVSYSAIANYDGAATLTTASAQLLDGSIRPRMARLFAWKNELYFFCTIKSGAGKWRWQIWKFNASLYDRFTLIYEHTADDDYGFCSVSEWDNKAWVITQKLDYAGDANPNGDDNKVYSSSNLTSWTKECDTGAIGCVMGEEIYDGKIFVSTIYNWGVNDHTRISYWDDELKNFVAEQTITTLVPPGQESTGDLITFLGELYDFKYREIYVRELSTNAYTEVSSWMEEYDEPVAGVYWDNRTYVATESILSLEPGYVYHLGLDPPATAVSGAAAATGKMTGDYMVVATFYRSGNYPVESNPSPDSATIALNEDAITIDASNNKIDFQETAATPLVATLVNDTYSRFLLCAEIKKQLEVAGDSAYTVTYNAGIFTIASSGLGGGGIFELLCNTGANKANAVWATIGFDDTSDKTGALTYDGETQVGKKIDLTNIPVSTDPKVNARRIYITTAGGARFYWIEDILDNTTTTLTVNYTDDEILGGDEVSYDRYPPPQGKFLEVWDNKLWIGGIPDYPHQVFYTNTNTSEEMANTNFLSFRVSKSERMMQIKEFGDVLFVFFETKVFRIDKIGASLFEQTLLPQNIGLAASWSVAVCDKFMCWYSEFGIEVFNGNDCFRPIPSRYVKRTLATINRDYLHKVIGGHHFARAAYWLAFPTGSNTEPDTVVVFEYLAKRLTVYGFPSDVTYLTMLSLNEEGLVFLTGTDDGFVYIQESGYDDDGTAISASFWTPWYYVAREKELHNILRRMFIKYVCPANFNITMKAYANFDKTAIITKDLAGSTPTTLVDLRKEILRRVNLRVPGTNIAFEFIQNDKTGGEVKIEGFDLYFNSELWRYSITGD